MGSPSVSVHAGVERQHLERNMALVVIQADDRIELLAHAIGERRVRHQRAGRVNAAPPGLGNGGRNKLFLLALAEQTVFARRADSSRTRRCAARGATSNASPQR